MKISNCLLRAVALGSSTDSLITNGPVTLKGAPRTNEHAIPLYYALRVSTTTRQFRRKPTQVPAS